MCVCVRDKDNVTLVSNANVFFLPLLVRDGTVAECSFTMRRGEERVQVGRKLSLQGGHLSTT